MKTKTFFFALLGSVILFAAGCSNEEQELNPTNDPASISVKLTGEELKTRATTPASPEENALKNYTIYVFHNSGVLEDAGTSLTMNNLTTGTKKIAVVANAPAGFPSNAINNYNDFENEIFALDSQTPATVVTDGLTMSGVISATLNAGSNNLTIPVARVVAKIQLGTITITPDTGHDINKFNLTAVHIMKAKSESTVGLPTVTTSGDLYGGVNTTGIVSEYRSFLTGNAAEGSNSTYFYVFPNGGGDDATLMTLEGTYDGVKTYFPFIINDGTGNTGDGSGNYINRNTFHKVNVTLKKLGAGVDNPETLVDPSAITVLIQAQEWETVPEQSVEW